MENSIIIPIEIPIKFPMEHLVVAICPCYLALRCSNATVQAVAALAVDTVLRHLGPSMWNSPAWKIDAPPQQNAMIHKNVKLYPAFWKYALCLIVCTWSHYLAGRMCTPSKYVCYFTRRIKSIYCVWSVVCICTLLIYVRLSWKQKLIHLSANL